MPFGANFRRHIGPIVHHAPPDEYVRHPGLRRVSTDWPDESTRNVRTRLVPTQPGTIAASTQWAPSLSLGPPSTVALYVLNHIPTALSTIGSSEQHSNRT